MTYAAGVVPKEKLIMGLPFYGCDWNLSDARKTKHVYYREVLETIQAHGGDYKIDSLTKSPNYRYTDANNENHHIWFENAESFSCKMKISEKLGLRGISTWVFIKEDPGCWEQLRDFISR